MGVQDDYQYWYLDDDRRFADQINGALFGGRQVVRPEELEQMEPQIVYLQAYGRCSRQPGMRKIRRGSVR